MASVERTAYPRFKRRPSAQELSEVYTPTAEELVFIRESARGPSPTLTVAVLLKVMRASVANMHAADLDAQRETRAESLEDLDPAELGLPADVRAEALAREAIARAIARVRREAAGSGARQDG